MKILRIILQILFLFLIAFIGDGLHTYIHIPIPGSIIGFLILMSGLLFKIIPVSWIEEGAGFMLAFLPLFFVPATIGVMKHPSLLSWNGIILIGIVILSTMITMIAAGRTSQFLERKAEKRKVEMECNKQFLQS